MSLYFCPFVREHLEVSHFAFACIQTKFSNKILKLNQSAIELHKEILLIRHGSEFHKEIVTNDKWELPVLIDQEICIKQVLAFMNFLIKSGTY